MALRDKKKALNVKDWWLDMGSLGKVFWNIKRIA